MSNTIVGYARISTGDQTHDLQMDALKKAGCTKIFQDQASGAKEKRPGLEAALDYLRSGDTLVVWKLDRLGRTTSHLVSLMEKFSADGIEFKSITDHIDTSSSLGKLIYRIMSSFAEFEHNLITERIRAGLVASRARGRKGGRLFKINAHDESIFKAMYTNRELDIKAVCKYFNMSPGAVYKTAKRLGLSSIRKNQELPVLVEIVPEVPTVVDVVTETQPQTTTPPTAKKETKSPLCQNTLNMFD